MSLLQELENVKFNGSQSDTLKERSKDFLWENIDRIIQYAKLLETPKTFSQIGFEYNVQLSLFEDAMVEAGLENWDKLGYDDYDSSLEIYGVENDIRLNTELQELFLKHGFMKVYVNHKDGWETHYNFYYNDETKSGDKQNLPVKGWRVRYGHKNNEPTNNLLEYEQE